ncbi:MAG TPA: NADH oxidase, partial [Turneriella sp.]|nr:NADH oxidase [Turneriella sp.]
MAIEKEITLPCGATLRNRLAKSAMSENLALDGKPHEKLWHLYETWGSGSLGLIITGNIMVDRNELGEPNNVILDSDDNLDHFREWTTRAKRQGAAIWAQLNHPGRQAPAAISRTTVAPSAIKLKTGRLAFRTPHALTEPEIRSIIEKFANTARLCKAAHFDGVQIHGAHGYLVSQFLSPLANERTDHWGGSIEN